jgi:hypothetical protein
MIASHSSRPGLACQEFRLAMAFKRGIVIYGHNLVILRGGAAAVEESAFFSLKSPKYAQRRREKSRSFDFTSFRS